MPVVSDHAMHEQDLQEKTAPKLMSPEHQSEAWQEATCPLNEREALWTLCYTSVMCTSKPHNKQAAEAEVKLIVDASRIQNEVQQPNLNVTSLVYVYRICPQSHVELKSTVHAETPNNWDTAVQRHHQGGIQGFAAALHTPILLLC